MKRKFAFNKMNIFALLLLCLSLFATMLFPCANFETAHAENFVEETVSDANFSVSMTTSSRTGKVLQKNQQTTTNLLGEEVTYFCFKWSELQSLKFKINSQIAYSANRFTAFSFKLTNVQADDLRIPLTEATLNFQPTTETLYHTNITQNKFIAIDYQYFIDSKAEITETPTRSRGNDFGLYKFDFSYTYLDSDSVQHTISFGDIMVAVLPDDVDEISNSINPYDIKIFYSVTSSNKLMNVFNLYLSSDVYRYVNPNYLQWNVVGKDLEKFQYVLTQKIKDENIGEYSTHRVLWPALASTTGTAFVFDSNDVEGTWTATCTIKTNDPLKADYVLKIENLSTVKQEQTSYLWLILTCVGVVVVVGVVVFLIIILKKRDKVW